MVKDNNINQEISSRRLPKNYQNADSTIFNQNEKLSHLSEHIVNLSKAVIIGKDGRLLERRNSWSSVSQYYFSNHKKNNYFSLKHFSFPKRLRIFFRRELFPVIQSTFFLKAKTLNKCLILYDEYSNNYFHWICEVLPVFFTQEIRKIDYRVVLPSNHNIPYVTDSLKILGITNILFLEKNSKYVTQKIRIGPIFNLDIIEFPIYINLLRKVVLTNTYDSTMSKKYERIYITRKNAKLRRLINEEEIWPILNENRFHILEMENLKWEDQVNILRHCKILVGVHGAGLTNMIWMPKESKILEIRVKKTHFYNNCYWKLSNALSHDYYYLLCESAGNHNDKGDDDLLINTLSIETILKHISND